MNIAHRLTAAVLAGSMLMAAAPGALAQPSGQSTEPPSTFDRIEKSLSEAASEAIDFVKSYIPYAMPEVQENGDIVIRKQKPDAGAATDAPATSAPETPPTGTATSPDVKI
ncbi:hypothetical protein [Ancylobacter sp. TS-1]|uniref:hypothetical protein n=1 Tax=Ancylobacter sp. TS-1 TaxID=1850374 RepID=UPI001265C5E2|nr:hypothetical protein [Ancylobacter sp. TS-1]QFR32675.1 hypothetical protein GBB76_05795 [Ancylobacter sp. TS-1]